MVNRQCSAEANHSAFSQQQISVQPGKIVETIYNVRLVVTVIIMSVSILLGY